jgi:hypothetical protein
VGDVSVASALLSHSSDVVAGDVRRERLLAMLIRCYIDTHRVASGRVTRLELQHA